MILKDNFTLIVMIIKYFLIFKWLKNERNRRNYSQYHSFRNG